MADNRKIYEPPKARVEEMTYEQIMQELVKCSKDDGFIGELMRGFMRVDPGLAAEIRLAESLTTEVNEVAQ